ncbi:MAG TPA: DUF6458 family protein [Streptosporangiaceae bacterium]|nr:DUF6458 family protein [Streptosporangiaceae bacterium]
MRTATGLTLVAIGAILAFAIRTSPSFLDLQVAGWVIMLTGVAGMLIPRRGNGRLRRRTVVWRPRSTAVAAGGGPRALGTGRVFRRPAAPGQTIPGPAGPAEETVEEYYQE